MDQRLEQMARDTIDFSMKIHMDLGPGLYERVYSQILAYKLTEAGYQAIREVPIPIIYEGIEFPSAFSADILVDDMLLIELKSIKALEPVHFKQTLTYLRLGNFRLGLLMNFGDVLLKNGIRRIAN